jgi:ATPase family associated with various cellular activities (AAA)
MNKNPITHLRHWFAQEEGKNQAPTPSVPQAFTAKTGLAANLSLGLAHVRQVAEGRLREHFGKGIFTMPDMQLYDDGTPLFEILKNWGLSGEEYLTLMIGLAPHLQPNFFDSIVASYLPQGGEFPEFGGVKGTHYRGMLPTGDTVLFILRGSDLGGRLDVKQHILSADNPLFKERILLLEETKDGEPTASGKISVSSDFVELCLFGRDWQPRFSSQFPAQLIKTHLTWDDLVVSQATQQELDVLDSWLAHKEQLWADEVLNKRMKQGFRALFYGPPGTGKTLAATLLGNRFNKPVYRVDLSQVVSKFIGETEKNLNSLFDIAENKNWILFFDEADALFGKRTSVSSSHDRYANQDVAYLLQRVEDFNGLVILASNFKNNVDQAFMRRFQSIIHFPLPEAAERLRLWQQSMPTSIPIAADVNISEIAQRYELSGSTIFNIIHISSLRALANGNILTRSLLLDEMRRVFANEGKTI